MRIDIIGAGNIGGYCAQRFVVSGKHEVKLSFSRDPTSIASSRENSVTKHWG
jgi:predicted dinucleotide-binding enzyme